MHDRDGITRLLEEGEHVDHVIKALAGPNRWGGLVAATVIGLAAALSLGLIVGLIVMYGMFRCLYERRLVVITNRAVLLLACGRFSSKPRSLIERLPADTPLRPLRGLWLELHLGSHRVYVATRSLRTITEVERERRDGKRP